MQFYVSRCNFNINFFHFLPPTTSKLLRSHSIVHYRANKKYKWSLFRHVSLAPRFEGLNIETWLSAFYVPPPTPTPTHDFSRYHRKKNCFIGSFPCLLSVDFLSGIGWERWREGEGEKNWCGLFSWCLSSGGCCVNYFRVDFSSSPQKKKKKASQNRIKNVLCCLWEAASECAIKQIRECSSGAEKKIMSVSWNILWFIHFLRKHFNDFYWES